MSENRILESMPDAERFGRLGELRPTSNELCRAPGLLVDGVGFLHGRTSQSHQILLTGMEAGRLIGSPRSCRRRPSG